MSRRKPALLVGLAVFFFSGVPLVLGQPDDDYTLTLPDVAGPADSVVDVAVLLDTANDLQGFQWGVCHEDGLLQLENGSDDIANGEGIDGLDFLFLGKLVFSVDDPGGEDGPGWTVGAKINSCSSGLKS